MVGEISWHNTDLGPELHLVQKRPSKWAIFVLLFFLIISTTLPLWILWTAGIALGSIITALLFGLIAFYLLRLYLWNTKGREILKITSQGLIQEIDYGWFQEQSECSYEGLHVEVVEENQRNRSNVDDQILDNLPADFPEKGLIRFYQKEDVSLEIHTKLQEPYLKDTYLRIIKEILTRSSFSNGNQTPQHPGTGSRS